MSQRNPRPYNRKGNRTTRKKFVVFTYPREWTAYEAWELRVCKKRYGPYSLARAKRTRRWVMEIEGTKSQRVNVRDIHKGRWVARAEEREKPCPE